jgi:hypothetical protein
MIENVENIKNIIRKEYPYLNSHFKVKRIGLFGSYATNKANRNSDIDLVVEFDIPIGFKFMALADYLEEKLKRKVDLLTPDGIASIRVKEVAERIKRSVVYV